MKSNILKDLSRTTQNHFGDNILFTFIGGSYAKNTQKSNSDIDIFVLLKNQDYDKEITYAKYFEKFHKKYGLEPGHIGEIFDKLTLDNLFQETEYILNEFPEILETACYHTDCILSIWRKGDVAMKFFLDSKILVSGDKKLLNKYIQRSKKYFKKNNTERIQKEKNRLVFPRESDIKGSERMQRIYRETKKFFDTPVGIGLNRWFGNSLSRRLCPKAYLPSNSRKRQAINKQCLGTYINCFLEINKNETNI
ncbi:MAG: nucleotidyltransferase domain-containing protein [Patescibacteria group bacterium]